MNQLLLFLLFSTTAFFPASAADGEKVKVYTVKSSNSKEKYLLIESSNDTLNYRVKKASSGLHGMTVLEPGNSNSPAKSNYFLLSTGKRFLSKEQAGKDCLIGVGGCLSGVFFIQAAGTEASRNNQPTGFYAYAGERYVEGPAACVPASLYLGGCFFGIKGIIELFLPRSKVPLMNRNNTATEAIKNAGFIIMNEKEFEITSDKDIYSGVIPYLLAEIRK